MEQSTAALNTGEEIKPYRIHVSSKYLELTKKKLDLTRLPHELLLPKAREWEFGTPKGVVEPLIDFWLEHYTWRDREEALNKLPQFRTAIALPLPSPSHPAPNDTAAEETTPPLPPLRIHFIHHRSPHPNAIPLLLLPPFPLTNLSICTSPLFTELTNPSSPTSTSTQPFHIICPSIPGLGFSDAFSSPASSTTSLLSQTAHLFNALMLRLGYTYYLSSTTGSGRDSPAGIDYRLARILGAKYGDNCLGVHIIEPCVEAPRMEREPIQWMKFNVARFFHANIWGYEDWDWSALRAAECATITTQGSPDTNEGERRNAEQRPLLKATGIGMGRGYGATTLLGLRESNTLSYALCDSPIGLLSLICSAIQKSSPEHNLTAMQIIDITQLAWLPGPEAGMRFWAAAVQDAPFSHQDENEHGNGNGNGNESKGKSRVAITVSNADGADTQNGYICPAWASPEHEVVFAQRVNGKVGLAIWERSKVLIAGIRGLTTAMDRLDNRLRVKPLEDVVVPDPEPGVPVAEGGRVLDEQGGEEEGEPIQVDVESPGTVVAVDIS